MSEHDQRGTVVLSGIAAVGVVLMVFVLATQFATWRYAQGALRTATNDAARAAARHGAPAEVCSQEFRRTTDQLLGGTLGQGVGPVRCMVADDLVTVTVAARFESWLPLTGGWDTTVSAVAVREVEPQ